MAPRDPSPKSSSARPSRASWVARWLCGAAAAAFLLLALGSLFVHVTCRISGRWTLLLDSGSISCGLAGPMSLDPARTGAGTAARPPLSIRCSLPRTLSSVRVLPSLVFVGGTTPAAPRRFFFAIVPLWMPATVAAIPSALAWDRHRRRHRDGACPTCHYDRRGLDPATPCPECGNPIA